MVKKETPPCCKAMFCKYNPTAPSANNQECIACTYLKEKNWLPVKEGEQ